ncbi:PAS domain-containing sensor histidine kinase [Pedobacter yonginense]|nr:PAS domain S-box protein [Pedobacter yonginense]
MQYSHLNVDNLYTYKTIIELSPFPIYLCMGEELIVTVANSATLKAWGKTQEAIGKPFEQAVPELENQPFKKLLLGVLHNGKAVSYSNYRADIIVDGILQSFYFTFSYQPFKNTAGKTEGVFCIANDVTELVLAKQNLNASEESSRLAIEAAMLGTFDQNLITGEIIWDRRCRTLFDVSLDSPVSYEGTFLPAIHPMDRERVNNHILNYTLVKSLSDGNYDIEYRVIGAGNGATKWVRSSGKVFFNEEDVPLRFIGTVFDITSIKFADEREAMLSAIIESSYDAIISKDLDGNIKSWNSSAERIFGYSADEMIGKSIYTIIPNELREEENQILARLKRGESVKSFETRRLSETKKEIDISLTISPVKDKSGKIVGISKIARDITEKKLAEKQKNDFITIASHELKTPLTTIKSYVQLILNQARKDGDDFKTNALSRVERQVNRMTILIENFLNNAQLIEGRFEIKVERFDIHLLLQESAQHARMVAPSHQITVAAHIPVYVMADRKKIAQVMENLLSNAIKYSPIGSEITINCEIKKESATISVLDRGFGIDRRDHTRLFERFYRVRSEKSKNSSGFGIGLFLVSEILKFHDSKIEMNSEENKGSVFYFDLPIIE